MKDELIELLTTKIFKAEELQKEYENNGKSLKDDTRIAENKKKIADNNKEKRQLKRDLDKVKKCYRFIEKRMRLIAAYNAREAKLLEEHEQKANLQHELYSKIQSPDISSEEKDEYKEMFDELSEDLKTIEKRLEKYASKKENNKNKLASDIKSIKNLEIKYGLKKKEKSEEKDNNLEQNKEENTGSDSNIKENRKDNSILKEDEQRDNKNNTNTEKIFAFITNIVDPTSELFRSRIKNSFQSISVELSDETIDKLISGETVNINGKEYRILESNGARGDILQKTYIITENSLIEKTEPTHQTQQVYRETAPAQQTETIQPEVTPVKQTQPVQSRIAPEQQEEMPAQQTEPIQPKVTPVKQTQPAQSRVAPEQQPEPIQPEKKQPSYSKKTNQEKIEEICINFDGDTINVNGVSTEEIETKLSEYVQKRMSEEQVNYTVFDKNIVLGLALNEEQLDKYINACNNFTELTQNYNDEDIEELPEITYNFKGLRKNKEITSSRKMELYQTAKLTKKMYTEMGRKKDIKIKMSLIDKVYFGIKDFWSIDEIDENVYKMLPQNEDTNKENDNSPEPEVQEPTSKEEHKKSDFFDRIIVRVAEEVEKQQGEPEEDQLIEDLKNTKPQKESSDLDEFAQRLAAKMEEANNEDNSINQNNDDERE